MDGLKLYKGNRVTLMACSSCNANCNDCYIGYNGDRTPEDLYNVAFTLLQDGKHVRIDDAEVLTNLEYLKTLKLVGQNWIMTNGLRIYQDHSIIKLLKNNGIDTVYMSYHFGIQNTIESIPSNIIDEVIKLLKDNGFNIYLNCTLTSKNCNGIIEYAQHKVMITPDSNVYCCNAMCKPGYEIDIYKNGKIYLYTKFNHVETICLAELLGSLNEETIEMVNAEEFPKLVKKYYNKRKKMV